MKKRQKRLAAGLGALAAAVLTLTFAPPPAAAATSCMYMFCANGCYCGSCTGDCEPDCYQDFCTVVATGCNTDD